MRFHRLFRALVLAVLLAAFLPVVHAAEGQPAKVALVIGNQLYAEDKPLANAANDASLMAKTLARLGFAVTALRDLNRADFAAAVTEFTERIPEGATALVYYAGHGMQVSGNNYLNPVDMQITGEQMTPLRAYALKSLLERLALSRSAVNIVILDACRNNPFRSQGAVRYRSFGNLGLNRVQAPRGTLIAYSTAPGQLAADGAGGNSIYTAALARQLAEPGREIEAIFKRVSTEVRKQTLDDQIPWYESSMTDSYYFVPPEGVTVAAGKPLRHAAAGAVADTAVRGRPAPAGDDAPDAADPPWYRQLRAGDWSQIDWEIQQRVKRATPDEIPLLEHKAGAGNVLAQTTLGLLYRDGVDKAVDASSGRTLRFKGSNTKALQWLNKAAKAGFPVAQAELGEMYYTSHGVERNLQQSRYWLDLAAQADYPRAKLDLLQLTLETSAGTADIGGAMNSMFRSLTVPSSPRPAQR